MKTTGYKACDGEVVLSTPKSISQKVIITKTVELKEKTGKGRREESAAHVKNPVGERKKRETLLEFC